MKKIFFTPGPTELHPEMKQFILQALDENVCSINHRSKEFMDIYRDTTDSFRKLMNLSDDYYIFFLGSATECMDRIIQNCVENYSFHFVNGAFAQRFYKTAIELNKDALSADVEFGKSFDFGLVDIPGTPELICITQNETSTGVSINPEAIYHIKERHPQSLVAVDIVTSAPYVTIDYDKIDCAFLSVQKGFGMPAGLGVLMVNSKCMDKARQLNGKKLTGSYHNFVSLHENAVKHQTSETPNVLAIYLLGKVCRSLLAKGIEQIRRDTEIKAKMMYDFFDSRKSIRTFVENVDDRSFTIINAVTDSRQTEIKNALAERGMIVGSGYGKFRDTQIRIANFPMHTVDDFANLIKCLRAVAD